MRILKISKHAEGDNQQREAMLNREGVETVHLSPTLLTAMTALKASKIIDKKSIDIIETDTKNAIAAISAKKISKNSQTKVVVVVSTNSEKPRSIPKDILRGVDLWLFESRRLMESYPENLNKAWIGKTDFSATTEYTTEEEKNKEARKATDTLPVDIEKGHEIQDFSGSLKNPEGEKNVLWIGDIKNTEKLRQTIDAVNEASNPLRLRICGAGNAASVMPAVKYTRALPNKHRITWVGEEYEPDEEIGRTDLVVMSDLDIETYEARALLKGKTTLNTDQLKELALTGKSETLTRNDTDATTQEEYIHNLTDNYRRLYSAQ